MGNQMLTNENVDNLQKLPEAEEKTVRNNYLYTTSFINSAWVKSGVCRITMSPNGELQILAKSDYWVEEIRTFRNS